MAVKVLFVCLGNICRSPTAHAVMLKKTASLSVPFEVESAGTSASHRGEAPDPRSVKVGMNFGYSFSGINSRPVKDADFNYYDVILAMDADNLQQLKKRCPVPLQYKLKLFMEFHPDYPTLQEVPDPYYGGSRGFEVVFNLIEQGCEGLISHLLNVQQSY
ncbi:MAG TPA: low molecular weight protein-tyrosine-phosphatase [Rheinheimera sp.]|nr:low molecular weight protein-tyrosine-phosphatase [Rheinheimera sp.]